MFRAHEAEVITRYLIGGAPTREMAERYSRGVRTLGLTLTPKEDQMLATAIRYPALLPYLDGGLTLADPTSGVRKRLRLMCAILETSPEHVRHFIPENDRMWFFRVSFAGLRGIFHAVVGLLIIRII